MEEYNKETLGESKEEMLAEQADEGIDTRRTFIKKALTRSMFAVGAMALVSMTSEQAFAGYTDTPHYDEHFDMHNDWEYLDHSDIGVHNDSPHGDAHSDYYSDYAHGDHDDHSDHTDHADHTDHGDSC